MALEHVLLVALREQPGSGLELTRRFERSLGFFWHATHQQIYRVLARMESDGWVAATAVAQTGRPTRREYAVTSAGDGVLEAWLVEPTPMETFRSEIAVKMRAASLGDREGVLALVRSQLGDHHARLEHYRLLEKRDYPEPDALAGRDLDQYLVLRGGVRLEEFWTTWLTEYLEAHA